MEPKDWKTAARDYDREVLSVYKADRAGKVKALIGRYGWKHKTAIDLGCGVGKFLPLLAERFGCVHACDYSADMLKQAQKHCGDQENVCFDQLDLRKSAAKVDPADFVLCVNVLLSASLKDREAMWKNLAASVASEGRIALVVPSLESSLFARQRLVEWNLRGGLSPAKALRECFVDDPTSPEIARSGLLDAGGIKTKHYLKEEIETTAKRFGLTMASCEKIEYRWTSEFNDPPRWMREPFPWDWLALLEKD